MNRDNELTYLIDVGGTKGRAGIKDHIGGGGVVLRSTMAKAMAPRDESEDDPSFLTFQSVEGQSVPDVLENARKMLAKKHRGEIRIYPAVKQEGKV